MSVLGLFIISLLSPTKDVSQAGIWAHYQDTLIITNNKYYYTNADAIRYMCSPCGEIKGDNLVGSCMSGGAELQLRQTDGIDTLFVVTTGKVWTPYVRGSNLIPETVFRPVINDSISSKHGGW